MNTVILGGGTYAASMIAYLQEHSELVPVAVLDDDPVKQGSRVAGIEVRGPISLMELRDVHGAQAALACLGDNRLRHRLVLKAQAAGLVTPSFVHPRASVSKSAVLGPGSIVLDGAVVQPHARLAAGAVVSSNATVAHHSLLANGVYLAAGVTIGAGIDIGERVTAGVASAVMTGVRRIGADAVLGAGAVVIRDVPAGAVMIGVPARQRSKQG